MRAAIIKIQRINSQKHGVYSKTRLFFSPCLQKSLWSQDIFFFSPDTNNISKHAFGVEVKAVVTVQFVATRSQKKCFLQLVFKAVVSEAVFFADMV